MLKIRYIVNQLNSFDENIQFTFEMEEEYKLAFLDVMVLRNTNDTINTTVYRKSTNTNIYINWHSHSPSQWKKTTANVLIQRAIKICFDKTFLDEELNTMALKAHSVLLEYQHALLKYPCQCALFRRQCATLKIKHFSYIYQCTLFTYC